MSCNVELSEEETLCLHQYFERVDHTEDLSFVHPAEYMAFQRIAGQVCKAGAAMLQSSCNRLLKDARESVSSQRTCPAAPNAVAVAQARPYADEARVAIDDDRSRVGMLLDELRAAFENGDPSVATALCTRDATIVSPLHGSEPASKYLSRMHSANCAMRLSLHDLRTNVEGRLQALGHLRIAGNRAIGEEAEDEVEIFDVAVNIDEEQAKIRSVIVFQRLRVDLRESELTA